MIPGSQATTPLQFGNTGNLQNAPGAPLALSNLFDPNAAGPTLYLRLLLLECRPTIDPSLLDPNSPGPPLDPNALDPNAPGETIESTQLEASLMEPSGVLEPGVLETGAPDQDFDDTLNP